ncbi:hypothetical protein ACFL4Y_04415 [Gemmatimonadota bacterium]
MDRYKSRSNFVSTDRFISGSPEYVMDPEADEIGCLPNQGIRKGAWDRIRADQSHEGFRIATALQHSPVQEEPHAENGRSTRPLKGGTRAIRQDSDVGQYRTPCCFVPSINARVVVQTDDEIRDFCLDDSEARAEERW